MMVFDTPMLMICTKFIRLDHPAGWLHSFLVSHGCHVHKVCGQTGGQTVQPVEPAGTTGKSGSGSSDWIQPWSARRWIRRQLPEGQSQQGHGIGSGR